MTIIYYQLEDEIHEIEVHLIPSEKGTSFIGWDYFKYTDFENQIINNYIKTIQNEDNH